MTQIQTIRKCVFPVAGLGTGFLPATKAMPKEMLPIVDKPLIQYAVEEAIEAGCTELIFITGRNKRSIEDHFDTAYELETELMYRNKNRLLDFVQNILPKNVTCLYIRQPQALGLGHAVSCARAAVGNEAFAVVLADDLIQARPGALSQMMQVYRQTGSAVVGVEHIDPLQTAFYGVAATEPRGDYAAIRQIVEKPHPDDAPSDLGVVGRYILPPRIFELLTDLPRGNSGEIQLTDALSRLLAEQEVIACPFAGTRYDCGNKLGYLKASVIYGLQHPEVGREFAAVLRTLVSRDGAQ